MGSNATFGDEWEDMGFYPFLTRPRRPAAPAPPPPHHREDTERERERERDCGQQQPRQCQPTGRWPPQRSIRSLGLNTGATIFPLRGVVGQVAGVQSSTAISAGRVLIGAYIATNN